MFLLPLLLNLAAWGQVSAVGSAKGPTSAPASQPQLVTVVLLHVNDVHGQTQEWRIDKKNVGGYARLATEARNLREEKKKDRYVLVLHAGDEFSRGDSLTRSTLGAANIELMNEIGFDAFTPGNGDFYDGWENLRLRAKQAKFPFLMANVSGAISGQSPGKPFVIIPAGRVKVAVLGLCFVHTSLPSAWGLKVEDPIATARKIVPELRKQADVVVLLTHLGVEEDKKLASKVGGIDVIVGGHSHTVLEHGLEQIGPDKKAVLICQAGDQLRYVGVASIELRREGKGYRVTQRRAELVALDQTIRQDPKIKASIARLAAATQPAKTATQPVSAPAQ
jgi:2',3'-cyclic-nucleotide 2'-phosphodiesterase (5'-nucleotidase family)